MRGSRAFLLLILSQILGQISVGRSAQATPDLNRLLSRVTCRWLLTRSDVGAAWAEEILGTEIRTEEDYRDLLNWFRGSVSGLRPSFNSSFLDLFERSVRRRRSELRDRYPEWGPAKVHRAAWNRTAEDFKVRIRPRQNWPRIRANRNDSNSSGVVVLPSGVVPGDQMADRSDLTQLGTLLEGKVLTLVRAESPRVIFRGTYLSQSRGTTLQVMFYGEQLLDLGTVTQVEQPIAVVSAPAIAVIRFRSGGEKKVLILRQKGFAAESNAVTRVRYEVVPEELLSANSSVIVPPALYRLSIDVRLPLNGIASVERVAAHVERIPVDALEAVLRLQLNQKPD